MTIFNVMSSKPLPPSTTPFFPNQFIKNQFQTKPCYPAATTDLSGVVAIVTECNTGLGLEACVHYLSYKISRLIMAVRTPSKGEAMASKLRTEYPKAKIDVWALEMCSYDSIRAFAARVDKELPRLDIAVLNAGCSAAKFSLLPATGHEETMQVNYLSTMLLTILLVPILKQKSPAGSPGRLMITTSMMSLTANFKTKTAVPLLASFDKKENFDSIDSYPTSKYLGQLFMWKLVERVSADDVVINLVEPGFIKGTDLFRNAPMAVRGFMYAFQAATARTAKIGALTYLDATIVKGKESHGCILMNWDIAP
jgi:NAD(P)-dependent dehydrogenase (short-subunit alcohol dehydrogenase family)